jgi:hypothetical protein
LAKFFDWFTLHMLERIGNRCAVAFRPPEHERHGGDDYRGAANYHATLKEPRMAA